MKIHFIAIGGSAMHNLAIALKLKGFSITGSDDAINDPSRSRLKKYNLLPQKEGWFSDKITSDIDAVVLGMHANCLLYTSPSPRDISGSRMPSSA